jgi:pyridoxine/pyridoxamine 5'-phosphate oxidase
MDRETDGWTDRKTEILTDCKMYWTERGRDIQVDGQTERLTDDKMDEQIER